MEIYQKIKELRRAKKMTQLELAKKVGLSASAVAMYERGEREPNIEIIRRYAEIFGVDINTLFCLKTTPVKIPVLGYVAAGIPLEAITEILDYEEINPDMLKDGSEFFALQIKGSSMEPRIKEGDVVIVRKQNDCDSGDVAIVSVNGDDATCKKVMKHESGIAFVPFNSAFETMFFSNREIEEKPITIWGKVVELRAKKI